MDTGSTAGWIGAGSGSHGARWAEAEQRNRPHNKKPAQKKIDR